MGGLRMGDYVVILDSSKCAWRRPIPWTQRSHPGRRPGEEGLDNVEMVVAWGRSAASSEQSRANERTSARVEAAKTCEPTYSVVYRAT